MFSSSNRSNKRNTSYHHKLQVLSQADASSPRDFFTTLSQSDIIIGTLGAHLIFSWLMAPGGGIGRSLTNNNDGVSSPLLSSSSFSSSVLVEIVGSRSCSTGNTGWNRVPRCEFAGNVWSMRNQHLIVSLPMNCCPGMYGKYGIPAAQQKKQQQQQEEGEEEEIKNNGKSLSSSSASYASSSLFFSFPGRRVVTHRHSDDKNGGDTTITIQQQSFLSPTAAFVGIELYQQIARASYCRFIIDKLLLLRAKNNNNNNNEKTNEDPEDEETIQICERNYVSLFSHDQRHLKFRDWYAGADS
jgi:hypothetical protein